LPRAPSRHELKSKCHPVKAVFTHSILRRNPQD